MAGGPLPLARAGVELAVRVLPELDDRLRYRAEFQAELHALPPLAQLRYAAGVLSQTFALRAALGSAPTRAEEDAMTLTTNRQFFWRCRVLRSHHWVTRSTEDGSRYEECSRCGCERDDRNDPTTTIGLTGGGGGGAVF